MTSSSRTNAFLKNNAKTLYTIINSGPLTKAGFGISIPILVLGILAPLIAPYDPVDTNLMQVLLPPSLEHLFGTDHLGRDVLSRTLYGIGISLQVGFFVIGTAGVFGGLLGVIGGFRGGKIEELVMRTSDVFFAFPVLVFAMVLAVAIGPGLLSSTTAMLVIWWPVYARIMRGSVLSVKHNEYVYAARMSGERTSNVLFRYIIPNSIAPVAVQATMDIGNAILVTAALSFIGLGAQPPMPELGAMIAGGREYIVDQWWIVTFPGLMLLIIAMSFYFLGDGLRDYMDPRLRGGR